MNYICGPLWDRRIVNIDQQGKVGIVMSGGLDSYVLYHLLDDPIVFNIKREDRFDNADRVQKLINRNVIEINEVSTNHWDRVPLTIGQLLKEHNVDSLFCGINHTPPIDHFPEFDTDAKPDRPWRFEDKKVKVPFLHLYKYHIIDLAYQLDLDLSDTMSCLHNLDTHCGECWQCKEREWGFEQMKKN